MNTFVRAAFLLLLGASAVAGNALDDYVWKPDDNYKWVDMGPEYSFRSKVGSRPYTAYTLNMTSQRWLSDAEFSAGSQSGSIWWHYLVVIVPDNLHYTRNGTIWITGCDQNHIPNQGDEDVVLSAALATNIGSVTGVLFQIPNEHTIFSSDPIQKSRSEDAIIAFTWDHFLKDTSDPTWLLRFPMVKASLRAMDTIRDFAKQTRPELKTSLDYFIVAGASKRGWTTWDVGAVDKERVQGIVPVVLDAINFAEVEHHQFRSYGGWSYALSDYVDMNITVRFDDPNMEVLQSNVDPYWYKDRLTMPKLVVNAGMDEFQQPDDTNYWWDQMPEPKKFMMIANAEHSLATGILEAVPGIGAWAHAILRKEKMPEFTWTIDSTTGDITATVEEGGPPVHKAVVWWASSCGVNTWDNNVNRRDYRIAHLDNPCSCGPISDGMCVNLATFWNKKELEVTRVKGKRTYTAHLDTPTDGTWTAFFIELKFVARKDDPTFEQLDLEDIKKHIKFDDSRMTRGQRAYKKEFERKYPNWAGFPKDIGGFFDFTTQVSVIPNTFPYPDCTGEGCGYRLVQMCRCAVLRNEEES